MAKRNIIRLVFLTLVVNKCSRALNPIKTERLLELRYVENSSAIKEKKINATSTSQEGFENSYLLEEVKALVDVLDKFSVSKTPENQSGVTAPLWERNVQKSDAVSKRKRPSFPVLDEFYDGFSQLESSYKSIEDIKHAMAKYRAIARRRFAPSDLVPDKLHQKMIELQYQYSAQPTHEHKDKDLIGEEMFCLAMFDAASIAKFKHLIESMTLNIYEQEMQKVGEPPYCTVDIKQRDRGVRPTRTNFLKFAEGAETYAEKVLDRQGLWEEIYKWEEYFKDCNDQEKKTAELRIQALKLKDPYIKLLLKREEALKNIEKFEKELEQAEALHPLNGVVFNIQNREYIGGQSGLLSNEIAMEIAKDHPSAYEIAKEKQELFEDDNSGRLSAKNTLELADAAIRLNRKIPVKTISADGFSRTPYDSRRADYDSESFARASTPRLRVGLNQRTSDVESLSSTLGVDLLDAYSYPEREGYGDQGQEQVAMDGSAFALQRIQKGIGSLYQWVVKPRETKTANNSSISAMLQK